MIHERQICFYGQSTATMIPPDGRFGFVGVTRPTIHAFIIFESIEYISEEFALSDVDWRSKSGLYVNNVEIIGL